MSKLVFGNQKMYIDKKGVLDIIEELKNVDRKDNIVMFPSYPFLEYYKGIVEYGAQDVSSGKEGAYTGEVSANQLKSLGATYSIVGHSECRKNHNETNETLKNKMILLLENGITPVFCIGESLEEYEKKLTLDVVYNQISSVYDNLYNLDKIIIAYEPIWAIGTGKTPTNDEINHTITNIKKYIFDKYNINNKVLYGGSVKSQNIEELNKIDIVDGYLIGGSSSSREELKIIIDKCK